MTRRLMFLAGLCLAGCASPGTYNLNVAVGPPAATTPSGTASQATPRPATGGGTVTPRATPAASGPGQLDQSQDSVVGFQQVGEGARLAQTFTPHVAGQLVAVGLRLKADSADRDGAMLVRSVDAKGHPDQALGSATLHGPSLPADGSDWTLAILDTPVPLALGTKYALVLTYTGGTSIFAGIAGARTYLDGTAYSGLTDGSTFWNGIGQNLAFRTYVR